ncbi:type 4a pilus biogenesis protein PilO [Azotosporobacter soli]|uniref:type 4a pilus biogenesis protein PilO n=1 Tax=Azotosporobacter soli TaxID=3055040 RepID=UPI0031FE70BA
MKWWRKLKCVQQLALTMVFIIGATLFFWHVVLLPQDEEILLLENRCREEEERNRRITVFSGQHPDSERYLQELEQRQSVLMNLLPEQTEVAVFMLELERLAGESKVRLSNVKPGMPLNKNGYLDIALEVQVRGDYFSLLDFLRRVEGANRFTAIDKAAVQMQSGLLMTKLMVHIYSFGTGEPSITAANTNS